MVGADKHWIEKDVIKYLRKAFATNDSKEEEKKEGSEKPTQTDEIPLKGVAKKRGTNFAFL